MLYRDMSVARNASFTKPKFFGRPNFLQEKKFKMTSIQPEASPGGGKGEITPMEFQTKG